MPYKKKGKKQVKPFGKRKPPAQPKEAQKRKKSQPVAKQLRDLQRLLSKDNLDFRLKKALTKRVDELQEKHAQNKRTILERKLSTRYHMAKFFERQKIQRRLDQAKKKAEAEPSDLARQEVTQLEEDLQYVMHFPKGEKFVSLLKEADTPEAQAVLDKERLRLRQLVKLQMADEALLADVDEGKSKGFASEAPKQALKGELALSAPKQQSGGKSKRLSNTETMSEPKAKKARLAGDPPVTKDSRKSELEERSSDSVSLASEDGVGHADAAERAGLAFDDDFFLGSDEQVPKDEPGLKAFELGDRLGEPVKQNIRKAQLPRQDAAKQRQDGYHRQKRPLDKQKGFKAHSFPQEKRQSKQKPIGSHKVYKHPEQKPSASGKAQGNHQNVEKKPQRTRAEGGRKRRK